jgi:hypothetical protein
LTDNFILRDVIIPCYKQIDQFFGLVKLAKEQEKAVQLHSAVGSQGLEVISKVTNKLWDGYGHDAAVLAKDNVRVTRMTIVRQRLQKIVLRNAVEDKFGRLQLHVERMHSSFLDLVGLA